MGIIQNRDAQFMLLAGFIIAIGLVITTVMLNSIIFEGNMAVESGGELSKNEIMNVFRITKDEIRSAYNDSDSRGGNLTNKTGNFSRQMVNFSKNLSKIYALHGEAVNITWDIEKWNSNQSANFTETGMSTGAANWTLVEGVNISALDNFTIWNVSILTGQSFMVEARNSAGGKVWSVEFNNSGYIVTNTTPNITYGSPLPVILNLSSPQYYFQQSTFPGPVSIHIINGNNAYGKFRIQGMANNKKFYRERHYILNATSTLFTNRLKLNISFPVSVPR